MVSRIIDDGQNGMLGRVFELLEEIEVATSEIHWRTTWSGGAGEGFANEATRLAREGEQLVARRADEGLESLVDSLRERRERLRKILAELDVPAADAARS